MTTAPSVASSSELRRRVRWPKSQVRRLRAISPFGAGQLFSSGTNLAAGLVAARVLPVEDFALFAFAQISLGFMQSMTRAAIGEPLLMHARAADLRQQEDDALASAAGLCAVSMAVFLGLSFVDLPLFESFRYAALAVPAFVLHDCLRYCAFARGTPQRALRLDAIWAGAQLLATALLLTRSEVRTVPALLAAWAVGAAVAVLSQSGRVVSGLRRGAVRRWITLAGGSSRDLTSVVLLGFIAAQVGNSAIAGRVSEEFLGAIRAALLIMAPIGALGSVVIPYTIPRMRNLIESGRREPFIKITVQLGVAVFVVMMGYVVAIWLAASTVLPVLIGSQYLQYRSVLLLVGLAAAVQVAVLAPTSALRSLRATRQMRRLYTVSTALGLGVLLGSTAFGEGAVLAALVGQSVLRFIFQVWALRRALATR